MEVRDFRVSFLWAQLVLDVTGKSIADGPLKWCANEPTYVEYFDRLQFYQDMPDLEFVPGEDDGAYLPWPHPTGQGFWERYLQSKPKTTKGARAWSNLVPFRLDRKFLPILSLTNFNGTLLAEGFLFPHGLGLVVTSRGRGRFAAEGWVSAAARLKFSKITVTWPNDDTGDLTLQAIADRCFEQLRLQTFGEAARYHQIADPVSIVTVTQGSGVELQEMPQQGGEVHRWVHAVTVWPRRWKVVQLPALAAGKNILQVNRTNLTASDILYAARQGRCVWYPSAFTDITPGLHTLACYHRNLVQAAVQVESLCGAVKAIATELRMTGHLDPLVDRLGRVASGLLGRIYGGENTYRSAALKFQIDECGLKPDINLLRQRHNNPPLA